MTNMSRSREERRGKSGVGVKETKREKGMKKGKLQIRTEREERWKGEKEGDVEENSYLKVNNET